MYSPKQFGKLIGKTVKTLQRWDDSGKLPAKRTPTNRRYYTEDDLFKYGGIETTKKTVIYTRVSTRNQKIDLINQENFLKEYCNSSSIIVDHVYKDFGSGLNYNRKYFNILMEEIERGEICCVIISHRDRLIRFGFDYFEQFMVRHGVKLIVVNDERTSPQDELVEDIISILHVFSCRLYGLRKYKKKIEEDESLQG